MNVARKSRVGTIGSVESTRKNRQAFDNQRDCQTVRPPNYENREEIVVYQQNAAQFPEAKLSIFELTHMVKAASCRAYCLNDWQL
jgi:hypothetical protein